MAIGTVGAGQVQNVGQAKGPAAAPAGTPAQFASQAADRTLGAPAQSGAVQTSSGTPPKDGKAVLDYARGKEGEKVGRGECFDLADEALKNNGFKTASDYGRVTRDGDYKWGKPVPLNDSKPGDVLQFRNYENKTTQEDGSWESQSRPHHTAIVVANDGKGHITILEQNAPEGSPVTERTINVGNGKGENGETSKTTGKIWAYRPEPKE